MGYSLSIDFGTPERAAKAAAWLQDNFEPWGDLLGGEPSYAGPRGSPSYGPDGISCAGFDYGAVDSDERYYIWRAASEVARLAGQDHYYYDDQPLPVDYPITPPVVGQKRIFGGQFDGKDMAPLAEAAIGRLCEKWQRDHPAGDLSAAARLPGPGDGLPPPSSDKAAAL